MGKLDALGELLLQATKWSLTPGNNRDAPLREALGRAALDVQFKRPHDAWPIEAMPETRALAELAIAASAAPRGALGESKRAIALALPATQAEVKTWRAEQAVEAEAAEVRRFPALAHLEGAAVSIVAPDPWKERADL